MRKLIPVSACLRKLLFLAAIAIPFLSRVAMAVAAAGEQEEKQPCAFVRQESTALTAEICEGLNDAGQNRLRSFLRGWHPQEQIPPAVLQASAPTPSIADNSFLIEEAYNQEYGVVQHISSFQRNRNGAWEYTFTQEWPFQPAPKHQFSYTLAIADYRAVAGAGVGFGDSLLNYRYQFAGYDGGPVAFAPRISLLLPTGSARFGRGAGGAGVEFNLPLSITVNDRFVTHFNAGGSIIPNAENAAGDEAAIYGYFFGESFIWRAHPRFHPLVEILFSSQQAVAGPGEAVWENSVVINPGFRWAYNFANGLQIVPGIAFPVEVGRANRGEWGIFLYLSFEHPFTSRR